MLETFHLDVLPVWIKPVHRFHTLLVPGYFVSFLGCLHTKSLQVNGFIYMVNTIPPLKIRRAKRGTAPDQKVRTPSSLNIRAAQTKLFLYSARASIDCILREIISATKHNSLSNSDSPSLDRIQRHRHVDGDDAGQGADAEGADGAQLLAGRHVRLRRLFERRIRAEARRRVGRLPRRRRHEALEEAADALFARDDSTAVQEAAHARLAGLAVVDAVGRES